MFEEVKKEEKKITANEAIGLMINAINLGDRPAFYKLADQYIKTLPYTGDIHHKLQGHLKRRPNEMRQLHELKGNITRLINEYAVPDEGAFLNEFMEPLVNDLILEWSNAETYQYHNIPVRNKILLHGPTGNGKTTIARHIASRANLPFFEVNTGAAIDSHIGTTGANIHMLFKELTQPCVLFWDEVDSIGMSRSSGKSAADNENDRMVNAILVNLEKMSKDVIFIGATNRMNNLDSAFVRRFNQLIEVCAPTQEEKYDFIHKLGNKYKVFPEAEERERMLKMISYSDIKNEFIACARKYVANIIKQRDADERSVAPGAQ